MATLEEIRALLPDDNESFEDTMCAIVTWLKRHSKDRETRAQRAKLIECARLARRLLRTYGEYVDLYMEGE